MVKSAIEHWDHVYATKDPTEVSWFQQSPEKSLQLINEALASMNEDPDRPKHVIDIGGGASTLVDCLMEKPHIELCVLDIAASALNHSMHRLGERALSVQWIKADASEPITELQNARSDVWHDRAVFHFLSTAETRLGYAQNLARILRKGGAAVISTFALDGPTQCSGLDVCRYDGVSILEELNAGGADLTLVKEVQEKHTTPWGADQSFVYTVLTRA